MIFIHHDHTIVVLMGSQAGQEGDTPDFHPISSGLTLAWAHLPFMTTQKKCALHEHDLQSVL